LVYNQNSKNHWVWAFGKKNQIQRIADSGYFKTLKEPPGFIKNGKYPAAVS
jgi:hypothetical protein